MEKKKIELDGKQYTVVLNDSATAKAFAGLSSFEVAVTEYARCHYWGGIPERLPVSETFKTSTPQKGGVYYADHFQSVAVYFDNSPSIKPYEIVRIGDIEEDLSALSTAGYSIKLKWKKS